MKTNLFLDLIKKYSITDVTTMMVAMRKNNPATVVTITIVRLLSSFGKAGDDSIMLPMLLLGGTKWVCILRTTCNNFQAKIVIIDISVHKFR